MKLWISAALAALTLALAGCAPVLRFTQPVVLLGEVHDNAGQHVLRLQTFKAWLAQGARPALLMEQFDRSRQTDIDSLRARATVPSADELIDAGSPDRKGWDWSFYKPFVALALEYELPIVAANVSRDEARTVIRKGLSAAGFDADVPSHVLRAQTKSVMDSHCGMLDEAMAANMALAQIARDQFMAGMVEAYRARGVLLLAGNAHVRIDVGVPLWMSPQARSRSEAIGVLEEGDERAQAYDLAIFTPTQERTDPCATMKQPVLR